MTDPSTPEAQARAAELRRQREEAQAERATAARRAYVAAPNTYVETTATTAPILHDASALARATDESTIRSERIAARQQRAMALYSALVPDHEIVRRLCAEFEISPA